VKRHEPVALLRLDARPQRFGRLARQTAVLHPRRQQALWPVFYDGSAYQVVD
jgi:hypothetical protein